ncbi:MAG: hypothetical protein OXN16_12610 [Gammaproteobacteria bacterium]|nr:hypothetical protein [Gammaproteobacteria bacterium]
MDISPKTIETVLRQLSRLPTPVSSWQVKTGHDSTDDPAVWVWATLKDDEVGLDKRLKLRSLIKDRIAEETGPSMIVYIRFRGASEMEQAV